MARSWSSLPLEAIWNQSWNWLGIARTSNGLQLLRYLAWPQPTRGRQSDEEKCNIGNNRRQQKQRKVPCPIAMESTEQIRYKPTQTNDDVAEDTHYEDAADCGVTQPMGEEKPNLPNNYAQRTGFFRIPCPVPPPFGLGPNHAKDYSDRGQ